MRGGLEAMGNNIGDLRDEAISTSCNCRVCWSALCQHSECDLYRSQARDVVALLIGV